MQRTHLSGIFTVRNLPRKCSHNFLAKDPRFLVKVSQLITIDRRAMEPEKGHQPRNSTKMEQNDDINDQVCMFSV